MTATLLHVRNPVVPHLGARHLSIPAGITVGEALDRSGWELPATTVLTRNGAMVKRREWNSTPIIEGEVVGFVTLPGKGGNGGSNPIMIVAELALIVAAYAAAGPLGASLAGALDIGVATATAIAQVGIMIAGNLLLSLIIPPPSQPKALPQGAQAYGLQAQSNVARIGNPIPERFGRECVWPDLAAAPYFEYDDNSQQILYQRFCWGIGDFFFEMFRVTDTVIWQGGAPTGTYPDLEIEIVPPGGTHTLVPETALQSSEVSNIHLLGTDEDGYDWSPSFTLNPPRTSAVAWGIDVSWPAGLYFTGSDGDRHEATVDFWFQAQVIDDLGNPVGDWFDILGSEASPEEITLLSYVPVTKSYKGTFGTPGRFQIRGKRMDTAGGPANHANATYWVGMRAYFNDVTSYDGVTTIGMKARASSGLNGSTAQQFNGVGTRILPLYDPETQTWSDPVATQSIAAAASYLLRSDNAMDQIDARIDLDFLWGLQATWDARGDVFNGSFTDRKSCWEGLQDVLGCGRTRPLMTSPIMFVRDEPRAAPATAFTPAQMLPNTFQIDRTFHDTNPADALLAIFINELSWTQDQVLCALPGSTLTEDDAPQLQIFGRTDRGQVFRDTMYQVAASFYRRKFPNFSTEADGRVVLFGSPVKVTHHVAASGSFALAMALEQSELGDVLVLSEPFTPAEDPPYQLSMLTPDGRVYGPVSIDLLDNGADSGNARVRLTSSMDPGGKYAGELPRDWPVWSGDGLQFERPKVMLATVDEKPIDALVVSMTPQKGLGTQVVTVVDDPRVYTADGTDGLGGQSGDDGEGDGGFDLTISNILFKQFPPPPADFEPKPLTVSVISDGTGADWTGVEMQMAWDGGSYVAAPNGNTAALYVPDPRPHTTLQIKARAKHYDGATSTMYFGDWFESDVYDVIA